MKRRELLFWIIAILVIMAWICIIRVYSQPSAPTGLRLVADQGYPFMGDTVRVINCYRIAERGWTPFIGIGVPDDSLVKGIVKDVPPLNQWETSLEGGDIWHGFQYTVIDTGDWVWYLRSYVIGRKDGYYLVRKEGILGLVIEE